MFNETLRKRARHADLAAGLLCGWRQFWERIFQLWEIEMREEWLNSRVRCRGQNLVLLEQITSRRLASRHNRHSEGSVAGQVLVQAFRIAQNPEQISEHFGIQDPDYQVFIPIPDPPELRIHHAPPFLDTLGT